MMMMMMLVMLVMLMMMMMIMVMMTATMFFTDSFVPFHNFSKSRSYLYCFSPCINR